MNKNKKTNQYIFSVFGIIVLLLSTGCTMFSNSQQKNQIIPQETTSSSLSNTQFQEHTENRALQGKDVSEVDSPKKETVAADVPGTNNILRENNSSSQSFVFSEKTPGAYEKELLLLINNYRIENGYNRWAFDTHLYMLAQEHSQAMLSSGTLSHESFEERFSQSGRNTCAENVGWNYSTAQAQFEGWKSSKGHNENMLKEHLKKVGISRVGAYVTLFVCS